MKTQQSSFSLIELLVALSVLAIMAAIIIPRYLGIEDQAVQVEIQADIAQFQSALSSWQSLGGTFTPATIDNPTAAATAFLELMSTTGAGAPRAAVGASTRNLGAALGTDPTTVTDSNGVFGSFTISLNFQPVQVPNATTLYCRSLPAPPHVARKERMFFAAAAPTTLAAPPTASSSGSFYVTYPTGAPGSYGITWFMDAEGRYWVVCLLPNGGAPIFQFRRINPASHSYDLYLPAVTPEPSI